MSLSRLLAPDDQDMVEHYPNVHEHRADLIVHMIGLAGAVIGGGILVVAALMREGLERPAAAAIYAAGLCAMLAISALYNLTRPNRHRRLLRRLDEAAIFVMIAGSYTPFTTLMLEGAWSSAVTGLVWAIALAGAMGKLFVPQLSERFWCFVYIGFGWLALAVFGPLIDVLSLVTFALLAAGGVIYTAGVLFFLWERLPYRRAIWHGFVLTGASLHYAAVATGAVLA